MVERGVMGVMGRSVWTAVILKAETAAVVWRVCTELLEGCFTS